MKKIIKGETGMLRIIPHDQVTFPLVKRTGMSGMSHLVKQSLPGKLWPATMASRPSHKTGN